MVSNARRNLSTDRPFTRRSVCLVKLANSGYEHVQKFFIEEVVDEIHLGRSVPARSVDLAIEIWVCNTVRSFPNV